MKLSILNDSEKLAGRYCDFFLDGENVNALGVFEASEEDGYIIVAADERTPSGHVRFILEPKSPYGCRTRTLNGGVRMLQSRSLSSFASGGESSIRPRSFLMACSWS